MFLPIALFAYVLNGISAIIDKNLIDHTLKNPFVYAFYIGILSLVVVVLIPFGFKTPLDNFAVVFSILSGIAFLLALITSFAALRFFDLTVVSSLVGTLNPLAALFLGYLFLGQTLNSHQLLAFAFLIVGAIILTFNLWFKRHHFNEKLLFVVASGLLFGLSYVLLKEAFELSSFIDGLIISRLTVASVAVLFLFYPKLRHDIFSSKLTKHHFANRASYLAAFGQVTAATSGLLLTYAVSLNNPALVNATFGVQHVVILAAALILYKKNPHILDENLSPKILAQKAVGIILIGIGLWILAF